MKKALLTLAFLLCAQAANAASTLADLKADERAHSVLLERIQRVETGGEKDPAKAIGDGGLARGWFQLHPDYYIDARQECRDLPADYKKAAADRRASRMAVLAYWRKYKAKTDRERALLHHYGATFVRKHPGSDPHGYVGKCGL